MLRITAEVSSRLIDSFHTSPKFQVLQHHVFIKERLWTGGFGGDFVFFLEEAAASSFLEVLFAIFSIR